MIGTANNANPINDLDGSKNRHLGWLWLLAGLVSPLGLLVAVWLWFICRLKKLALFTLLVTILGLGVYLLIYYKYQNAHTLDYRYQSLQVVQVSSGYPNTAIAFSKPVEFAATDDNKTYLKNYQHKLNKKDSSTIIGDLAASSIHITGQLLTDYPPFITDSLHKPASSPQYQAVVEPLISFASIQLPPALKKVELSDGKDFRTSNIKTNAWQFNLTASNPDDPKAPLWQGKVFYLWGKNGAYYFIVTTIKQNWPHSQQIWQQVVDSIKIDQ